MVSARSISLPLAAVLISAVPILVGGDAAYGQACTPKTCPAGAWSGGSFGWGLTYGLGGAWYGTENYGDWYLGPGMIAPLPAPRAGRTIAAPRRPAAQAPGSRPVRREQVIRRDQLETRGRPLRIEIVPTRPVPAKPPLLQPPDTPLVPNRP
jgi:hypothetical protein